MLNRLLFLAVAVFSVSVPVKAQDPGAPPVSREQMWPAPTSEEWRRPCLIQFQRTWEDALAVSRETGKPILICVNMDGEIASEHYAGIRYRDPEIAALYEPYVCVIASVYRHTPRDFDEHGNRILCPRFGSVTCGEHIEIEPGLYKEFFDGKRIAPRHIGVELNGEETYDVYYAFDTDSVFSTIREGIETRDQKPTPVVRGDRPIVERVASRDIQDRIAVEKAYGEGDRALRRSLLEAAAQHPEAAQVDLLRLAVFGFDIELGQMARQALARSESPSAYNLISETLRVPMEAKERDSLISAMARLGESSPRARMLAVVHRGLAGQSDRVDVDAWLRSFDEDDWTVSGSEEEDLESRFVDQDRVLSSEDPIRHLELAEAFLTAAFDQPDADEKFVRSMFMDACQTALKAEKLGSYGWRLDAVIGLAANAIGDKDEAYTRADAAVRNMPAGTRDPKAMAMLELFAEARRRDISKTVREQREWEAWSKAFEGTGAWLTDVHAAYTVLSHHPYGTDAHVATHYDFLKILGATGQAYRILDAGLARFPDSWILHDRLRGRILREKGVSGLETAYEVLLREKNAHPDLKLFAGYASLVAAEFHRRMGHDPEALAAYNRGIAYYETAIESSPDKRDTADHFIALAIAGRARIAFEQQDYATAVSEIESAFRRKPDAAATLDGLGISPVDTAKMLRARLAEANQDELAARVDAALESLDPVMLELPAYEREGPSPPSREGGARGRRGQRSER